MKRSPTLFLCRCFSLLVFAFSLVAIYAGSSFAQPAGAAAGALIGATEDTLEDAVPFPGQSLTADGNGALPPRLALVIGIKTYDPADHVSVPDLPGAATDAARVVRTLTDAGFLITEPRHNGERVTRLDMLEALNVFSQRVGQLKAASGKKPVVFVYFGGHGVTNGADNFLIPSDFNPTFQEDLPNMALPLATIRQRLAALDVSLRYIVLDACRNVLPLSLPSVAGGGSETYRPGMTRAEIDTAGETIWFATLSGAVAADAGATFTQRLMDVLDRERAGALRDAADPRFADGGEASAPLANAHGNTSAVLDKVANAMAGSGQIPDRAGNPPPLILYPTRANYRAEFQLFKQFDTAASQYERRYCLGKTYLDAFFLYSYFSSSIYAWKNKFESLAGDTGLPACTELTVNQPESADLPVKAVTGEWRKEAPAGAPPAGDEPLTLDRLRTTATLSAAVRQAIGGFSGETPVRRLAVAGADLSLFRHANAGEAMLAMVDRGQLLSVGAANGAFVEVRTAAGQEGYVEQKLVNAGATLLRVVVSRQDNGDLDDASKASLAGLTDTVVYDAAIEYRQDESQSGLLSAIAAFDDLRATTFIPDDLIPLYRAADPASLPQPRSVRILLSALPLDPGLRGNAYSYTGGAVTLEAALKLSQPVLASASSGPVIGGGSACAAPLAAAAGKVAIVRYPSQAEALAAESVRRVLGTAGFATPDPIQKGTRIERQGTRITYCASDQPLIDLLKVQLSSCFGAAFRTFPTSDPALCASGRLDVVVTDAALADN